MNRQFKPGRQTVALNPAGSRIRRAPVQIQPQTPVVARKVRLRTREEELWLGAAGIVMLASACAALIVGISAITRSDGAAPVQQRFSHCYSGNHVNCVSDGDTVTIDGQRVEIAGMDAPEVRDAGCLEERRRGINSAVRLRALLNSGDVKLRGTQRAHDGRLLTRVEVNGRDVAAAMVASGAAREYGGGPRSWCA